MGEVAVNAIPKGVANVVETPLSLGRLALKGMASLPGAGHLPWLQDAANEPELAARPALDVAQQTGLYDPAKNPQTPEQRIVDAMVQGGVGMAMPGGLVKNMATGAASAGAGQLTTELTGSPAAGAAVSMATPFVVRRLANPQAQAANAVRDATLKEGQKAGLAVKPTATGETFMRNRMESLGGKAATKQALIHHNQPVVNRLAAADVDIPPNASLTPTRLAAERDVAATPYREIAKLSPTAEEALTHWRQAKHDANKHWTYYFTSKNPEAETQARKLSADAKTYEDILVSEARAAGRGDLIEALAKARVKLGKLGDIENVTSYSGEVSAPMLGSIKAHDPKKLSGNLDLIARFQQDFPETMMEAAKTPTAGVSKLEAIEAALLGAGGASMMGGKGLALAALPLSRPLARQVVASPYYQRFFTQPNYAGLTPQARVIQSLLAGRTHVGLEDQR